jgi:plastocyanin
VRAFAILVLASVLAACAAGTGSEEPVATDVVNLPPSYKFEPSAITVADGTTVTWTNNDNFTHNVRLIDDGGELLELPPGASVTHTFTGVGEHRYDCSFHPNDMTGVVVVTES